MTEELFDYYSDMKDTFTSVVMQETRRRIKDLKKGYDIGWANTCRIEYLKGKMTDAILRVWKLQDKIATLESNTAGVILIQDKMADHVKRLIKLQGEVIKLRHPRDGDVTPEEIEAARAYPFEDLLDVKGSMALCPFHPDKTPSFWVKSNRGKCWSCGWKGDPIDFVKEKDGIGFVEAVRKLQ